MTEYWEIPIPIKNAKTDENRNIQTQPEIDDDHEDFIYEEEPVKPEIAESELAKPEINLEIQEYGEFLDKSTLNKEKKDILNLSLTTNTTIHTVTETIEDPKEKYLNSVLQEKTDDSSCSSSKKVMTEILERLAVNSINTQNNNVDISINVTEELQKSPERSPRLAYNEDNQNETNTENPNETPAKRIKLDKRETAKNKTYNDTTDESKTCENVSHNDTTDKSKSSEKLYIIEKIVKSRMNPKNKKQLQYFIKWEGWSAKTNTWEPADYIRETVPGLVKIFEQSKKNKKAGGGRNNTRKQQQKKVQTKKSAL